MSVLTLRQIRKSYGDIEITKGVDLDIQSGEFVVFVGPSGCGKSTLLRMIAGLEEITSGDLYIGDVRVNELPPVDRSVGMVFQSYALYPHLTVAENMAFGLKLAKVQKAEIADKVNKVAKTLQLDHLLDRKPKDLSGGQRQRVAIGRTMVREPDVLLFDEPLSNLDAGLRVKMRIEIAKLHQRLKATMVYVTHDQVEAMTLADKIVVLKDGLISQVGKPITLYHYPDNQFVAGFIGSPQMNFFEGHVCQILDQGVTVKLISGEMITAHVDGTNLTTGQAVTLGYRPEHFVNQAQALVETEQQAVNHIKGRVQVVERLGDHTLLYLDAPASQQEEGMVVQIHGDHAVEVDSAYLAQLDPDRCHLFMTEEDGNGAACRRLVKEES